eukprot:gene8420-5900_t
MGEMAFHYGVVVVSGTFFQNFIQWHDADDAFAFLSCNENAIHFLAASYFAPEVLRHHCDAPASLELVVRTVCCGATHVLDPEEVHALRQLGNRFPAVPSRGGEVVAVETLPLKPIPRNRLTQLGEQFQILLGLADRAHHTSCDGKGRKLSRDLLGEDSLDPETSGIIRCFCAALVVCEAVDGQPGTGKQRFTLPRGVSACSVFEEALNIHRQLFCSASPTSVRWAVSASSVPQRMASLLVRPLLPLLQSASQTTMDRPEDAVPWLVSHLLAMQGFQFAIRSTTSKSQQDIFGGVELRCRYCGATVPILTAPQEIENAAPCTGVQQHVMTSCSLGLTNPHRSRCCWNNLFLQPVLRHRALAEQHRLQLAPGTPPNYNQLTLETLTAGTDSPQAVRQLVFQFHIYELADLMDTWRIRQPPASASPSSSSPGDEPEHRYPLADLLQGPTLCDSLSEGDPVVKGFLDRLQQGPVLGAANPTFHAPAPLNNLESVADTLWRVCLPSESPLPLYALSPEEKACLSCGLHATAELSHSSMKNFEEHWCSVEKQCEEEADNSNDTWTRCFYGAVAGLTASSLMVKPLCSFKPSEPQIGEKRPPAPPGDGMHKNFLDQIKESLKKYRAEKAKPPPLPAPKTVAKAPSPAPAPYVPPTPRTPKAVQEGTRSTPAVHQQQHWGNHPGSRQPTTGTGSQLAPFSQRINTHSSVLSHSLQGSAPVLPSNSVLGLSPASQNQRPVFATLPTVSTSSINLTPAPGAGEGILQDPNPSPMGKHRGRVDVVARELQVAFWIPPSAARIGGGAVVGGVEDVGAESRRAVLFPVETVAAVVVAIKSADKMIEWRRKPEKFSSVLKGTIMWRAGMNAMICIFLLYFWFSFSAVCPGYGEMDVAPRAEDVDGKWNEIQNLRRHMQDTSAVRDSEKRQTIHPGRTVDGPTLGLLKSPNYPFTLCEEAPASYVPPPVPFDVDEEVSRLRDLVLEVQDDLEGYSRSMQDPSVAEEPSVVGLSPEQITLFLNESIPFVELAWGISSLQWFQRWVLSHSISALWTAKEQLEYVLTDNGQSLPRSVEEIEFHTQKCPFPMAVDRLEKDRKAVIQLERSRLHSASRTYRERVPASVVTAATTPYMTAEEKYVYQEIFNETEHRMQTLHLARMKDRASRGNSALNTSRASVRQTSLIQRTSISLSEPEIQLSTAEALHALEEEEHVLRDLIQSITERKRKNIRFDKSEIEQETSRSAQITVYGCLASDENLMSAQVHACDEFLTEYEEWLRCYGLVSHDNLMAKLSEMSGEIGKWPAPQPGGHDHHHHHPSARVNESVEDKKGENTSRGRAPQPSQQAHVNVKGSSVTNQPPNGLIGDDTVPARPRSPPVKRVTKSSHGGSVAQILFGLLEQMQSALSDSNGGAPSSKAINRMWFIQALRVATTNFMYGVWEPRVVLSQSHQIEEELQRLVTGASGQQASGGALIQIISCLCEALAVQRSSSCTYDVVSLHVPTVEDFSAPLGNADVAFWGALLDALWFQVDPSGDSNGGLLPPGEHAPTSGRATFLNLCGAALAKPSLHLFYSVDQGQCAAYTLREVVEKPMECATTDAGRMHLMLEVMSAFQQVENVGVLSFYACRVDECALVPLSDTVFVYMDEKSGEEAVAYIGLLPPPAVALRRFQAAQRATLPEKVYNSPINFSSIGLQLGDLLCFAGTTPNPPISSVYYYGETLREQSFWEMENKVVPHAFVALPSHPLNMGTLRLGRPLSIQRDTMAAAGAPSSAAAAPRQRQLTAAILRQLKYVRDTEGLQSKPPGRKGNESSGWQSTSHSNLQDSPVDLCGLLVSFTFFFLLFIDFWVLASRRCESGSPFSSNRYVTGSHRTPRLEMHCFTEDRPNFNNAMERRRRRVQLITQKKEHDSTRPYPSPSYVTLSRPPLPFCSSTFFGGLLFWLAMQFRVGRSNTVILLHYGSLAVISGYAVCLTYRLGWVKKVLRPSMYDKLEGVVERLKAKTSPMGPPARLQLLRSHLLQAYSYTFSGMVCLSAGIAAFMWYPRFPLMIAVVGSVVPGVLVAAVPRKVVGPTTRRIMFHVCWLFGGYSLGPIGWVAQDVLATYVLVTTCTVAGITVPLYLTRGIVTYCVSAQVLSFALSTYAVTSTTNTLTLFGVLKSHPGVQQILNSDVNGILFLQLVSNIAIQSFHTLPKIKKYINWKNSDDALKASGDPLWDAHTICAGWTYVGYRMIRGAFHRVLRRLSGKDSEGAISAYSADSKSLKMISSISSGLVIGVIYVQVITRLQQGDIEGTLGNMRQFFRKISPRIVPSSRTQTLFFLFALSVIKFTLFFVFLTLFLRRFDWMRDKSMALYVFLACRPFAVLLAMTELREVQTSAVFGVPSFAVGNKLKDLMAIREYGRNKVVSCCILENAIPSTKEGCVRRCTLSLKRFQGAVLREKALKISHEENRTTTVLEYLPSADGEVSRSPFGPEAMGRLNSAVTTYSVHKVTNSLNRCYVDFTTKLEIRPNPNGDEKEEKELFAAIEYFWSTYLESLILSLEAEVLSEAYPVLSGKIDTEFRKAYEAHEQNFCEWAASSKESFPRAAVLENYENVLVCWSRVLQEYRHQKLVAETVRADVDGAKKVAEESARQLACSEAALEAMKQKVEELSDPPCFYRPPNEDLERQYRQDKKHPDVAASRARQFYQTASTTDRTAATELSPGPAAYPTRPVSSVLPNRDTAPAPKPPATPSQYSPNMLRNLFTARGVLNEPEVEVLFKVLDPKSNRFLTSDEIKTILLSMDHLGLYEDRDGTLDELERYRMDIREVYAARYSTNSPPPSDNAREKAASRKEDTASSALERMVNNHNERKEAQRESAMHRIAEDTVNRFCFREGGKIYFDEFCLALMHLFNFAASPVLCNDDDRMLSYRSRTVEDRLSLLLFLPRHTVPSKGQQVDVNFQKFLSCNLRHRHRHREPFEAAIMEERNEEISLLRRGYSRTIAASVRSLPILEKAFDDALERWHCVLEALSDGNGLEDSFPLALKRDIRSIASQVRCIQQEVVTYLGEERSNTTVNSCKSSLEGAGGGSTNQHVDCARKESQRGAATCNFFVRMLREGREAASVVDTSSPQGNLGAWALARRAATAGIWLSITTADFEWLTTCISSADGYVLHGTGAARRNCPLGVTNVAATFFRLDDGTSCKCPHDEALVLVLVLWYHCFVGEDLKSTKLIGRLEYYFSAEVSHRVTHAARCICSTDLLGLLSALSAPLSARRDDTQWLFLLQLFVRCMAHFIVRQQLLRDQVGSAFRPVIPVSGGEGSYHYLAATTEGLTTDAYWVPKMIQLHFLRDQGGLWPLPEPLVKAKADVCPYYHTVDDTWLPLISIFFFLSLLLNPFTVTYSCRFMAVEASPLLDPYIKAKLQENGIISYAQLQDFLNAVVPTHIISQNTLDEASVSSIVSVAKERIADITDKDVRSLVEIARSCAANGRSASYPFPGNFFHYSSNGLPLRIQSLAEKRAEMQRQGRRTTPPQLTTFCRSLDELLGGGLQNSAVTEVSGPPGVGKTQLLMQLAVNCTLPLFLGGLNGSCLFLDTEGSFVPERFYQIVSAAVTRVKRIAPSAVSTLERSPAQRKRERRSPSAHNGPQKVTKAEKVQRDLSSFTVENVMKRVQYCRIADVTMLMAVLHSLPDILQEVMERNGAKVQLILLDSVAMPFRALDPFSSDSMGDVAQGANSELGSYHKTAANRRSRLLFMCAQLLHAHAVQQQLAVVVTNHVVSRPLDVFPEAPAYPHHGTASPGASEAPLRRYILLPALGESWGCALAARLVLSFHHYHLPFDLAPHGPTTAASACGYSGEDRAEAQHRVARIVKGGCKESCFAITRKGIRDWVASHAEKGEKLLTVTLVLREHWLALLVLTNGGNVSSTWLPPKCFSIPTLRATSSPPVSAWLSQPLCPLLASRTKRRNLVIWGKIFAYKADYIIVQAFDDNLVAEPELYYTVDEGLTFTLLGTTSSLLSGIPEISDDPLAWQELKQTLVLKMRGVFVGDPAYEYRIIDDLTGKATSYKESVRIALFVEEHDYQCRAAPRGAYIFSERNGTLPREIKKNTAFKGLPRTPEGAVALKNYYHIRAPNPYRKLLEKQKDILFEKTPLEKLSENRQIDAEFDPLTDEVPNGIWRLRYEPKDNLVVGRHARFVGSIFYHVPETAIFGTIYMGDGTINQDVAFEF